MNRFSYASAVDKHSVPFQQKVASKNVYFKQPDSPSSNWLLPGEEIKYKDTSVGYQSDQGKIQGSVWVTTYRLRFQRFDANTRNQFPGDIWNVALGTISNVKKMGHSKVSRGEDSYGIKIKCKDMRKIIFYCNAENHSRRDLYENLRKYSFPNSNKLPFFATLYKADFKIDGWSVYDADREFRRMGIPDKYWDFTDINRKYEFVPTYPSCLVLPRGTLDRGESFIQTVAEFRSKKRVPVLSWYKNELGVSVTRSSQPMIGISSKRSSEDEIHIQMIVDANPSKQKLLVLDARPLVNARVNRAVGGGYEEGYENCELVFLDIQNIHVVRDSLKGVKGVCYPRIDFKRFNKALEDTGWLGHLETILNGARRAVTEIVKNRRSILVHCSDGWDRTSQLISLTTLQLDSYYRTLEGFIVLIEKDWCSFGHKFAHRIGHGEDKHGDEERSPIFVQFIDCVWQLFSQYTNAFEFNVQFLKTVLDELYACRFGTFLYNSEKERTDLEVKQNTASLWSYILDNRSQFVNPSYNPSATSSVDYFLSTSKGTNHAKIWSEYYCQHSILLKGSEAFDSQEHNKNALSGVA